MTIVRELAAIVRDAADSADDLKYGNPDAAVRLATLFFFDLLQDG